MRFMKHALATMAICLLTALPVRAESDQTGEGWRQLSEGSRILLERLMGELAPMMAELRAMIDDLALYEMPEVQEDGDIIIRRKEPLPPKPPEAAPAPDGAVDL